MSSDADYGIHLPAILLNFMVGGVRVGSGTGFICTLWASGTSKVHMIWAGVGLPLMEPPDDDGEWSCLAGGEAGAIMGCDCCRGRPDGLTVCNVSWTNGSIDTPPIKSDASLGRDCTLARAVHEADG